MFFGPIFYSDFRKVLAILNVFFLAKIEAVKSGQK